jgi:G:T/U-mismatch repair DNA glycosylase
MLPPLLDDEVMVVFVGTEPGTVSERIRHYYAGTGNSFYGDLKKTGWTDIEYSPEEDTLLLRNHHIGLDDVYNNKQALASRLQQYEPQIVCFNNKEALKRYSNVRIKDQWAGPNASRYAQFPWNPIVWALYDSSARARYYHQKRLELLKELLRSISSKNPSIRLDRKD